MITIVVGTNRTKSNSYTVAKNYQRLMKNAGVDAEILSLESLPENFIQTDLYGKRSIEFQPIQDLISKTEKFLFIIPEYNGSFPGVLKTFIDACSFPESFFNKKAALVGISSGKYGNIRGIEHFTGVCHYINLHVMPLKLHISYIREELNELGELSKADTSKFVDQQIDQFLKY